MLDVLPRSWHDEEIEKQKQKKKKKLWWFFIDFFHVGRFVMTWSRGERERERDFTSLPRLSFRFPIYFRRGIKSDNERREDENFQWALMLSSEHRDYESNLNADVLRSFNMLFSEISITKIRKIYSSSLCAMGGGEDVRTEHLSQNEKKRTPTKWKDESLILFHFNTEFFRS